MKILIVGPSWVGDMVMAQTAFISLRQQFPQATIDVLAPKWSRPLLERMPEVNKAIDMPLGHGVLALGTRWKLAKQLQKQAYTKAYVLPNSLKSALVPLWAKIPQRTGWRGEWRYGLLNDLRVLDKTHYPLMIERFIALTFAPRQKFSAFDFWPKLQADEENAKQAMHRFGLSDARPIIGLAPGAEFGPAKRWPSAHYAQVAKTYVEKGYQVWIFGSEKDAVVGERIQAKAGKQAADFIQNLAGVTVLADAIDLLAKVQALVTNDSGLMHISAALDRPVVVLYGSSAPEFTPPLTEKKAILRLGLDCSPCFKRDCPLGHLNCLKQLLPEQALNALTTLLADKAHV